MRSAGTAARETILIVHHKNPPACAYRANYIFRGEKPAMRTASGACQFSPLLHSMKKRQKWQPTRNFHPCPTVSKAKPSSLLSGRMVISYIYNANYCRSPRETRFSLLLHTDCTRDKISSVRFDESFHSFASARRSFSVGFPFPSTVISCSAFSGVRIRSYAGDRRYPFRFSSYKKAKFLPWSSLFP